MEIEILVGLFAGCLVSGLFPLVNAELLVVAAAAAGSAGSLPAIVLVAATGQMVTKTSLYSVARWAPNRLGPRTRARLEQAAARVGRRRGAIGTTILASAICGLPPFFGVSLAAGALGVRARTFVLSGLVGRVGRFALLGWAAQQAATDALDGLGAALAAVVGVGTRP